MSRFLSSVLILAALCLAGCPAGDPAQTDAAATAPTPDGVESPTGGACKVDPPAEPMACTMEWDPVCGCDGQTYGNACAAKGAGVTRTTPGACDDDS